MISLLPPQLKSQIRYSRRNTHLVRYISMVVLIGAVLIALIGGGLWYSSRQSNQLHQTLAQQQAQRENYKETELQVKALQSNISLIQKLFNEQTRYSSVLADFAAVLPAGAYIDNVALSGDDTKPLHLIVAAKSFASAGLVRNGLLKSDRLNSVDVQTITRDSKRKIYIVDMLAAFKPGKAR